MLLTRLGANYALLDDRSIGVVRVHIVFYYQPDPAPVPERFSEFLYVIRIIILIITRYEYCLELP